MCAPLLMVNGRRLTNVENNEQVDSSRNAEVKVAADKFQSFRVEMSSPSFTFNWRSHRKRKRTGETGRFDTISL